MFYHWALWDRLGLGKVFPHVDFISTSSCHNTQIQLWKLPWASQHLPWMITDHSHAFIVFEFLSISSAWKGGWCALQWRQKTVFRESAGSKILLSFVYTGHEWQGQAQHGVTWIFLWVISIYSHIEILVFPQSLPCHSVLPVRTAISVISMTALDIQRG